MGRAKRYSLVLAAAVAALLIALGAAACGGSDSGSGGGDVVLTVSGPEGTKTYTLDQVRDLPSTEGYAGIKSSTGKITPPVIMKGVLIDDLFAEVGGLPENAAVGVIAKDGYEMTFSVSQLRAGEFLTYDMVTGEEKTVDEPLRVIVAYEVDGEPIDPEADGPLRLAMITSEQNQVTDGHWSVKWVTEVKAKPIVQEWTLSLKGALTEEMDRGTFESGSAIGCHGQEWIDADGDKWTGIPLYLLVGRVDDEISHEGPAYNRDLAEAGYQVKITAADGYSIEVSSETMYYNKHLIVAYELNGEPLPEKHWPLRLVGEGIEKSEMIGQVTQIEALLPAE
ncbi:MAG: molybdopterin-dependent oxidoreductase [Thermoleophilia bacterium]|nr:molybdopterin-dependent oxidoreductase [Thermoleophilia bacterium]